MFNWISFKLHYFIRQLLFVCTHLYDSKYFYLIEIICTQLYGLKCSYLMLPRVKSMELTHLGYSPYFYLAVNKLILVIS